MTTTGSTGLSRAGPVRCGHPSRLGLVLRAPPFAAARPAGHPKRAMLSNPLNCPVRLAAALSEARVGGSFWRDPSPLPPCRVLILAHSSLDAAASVATMRPDIGDILVWLPGQRPKALAWPDFGPGVRCLYGDADPWTLIDRIDEIVADPDEIVALLAAAAGKPVRDIRNGHLIERAAALDRLTRRVACFDYTNPFSGQPICPFDWIEILGEWRRQIDANRRIGVSVGIARWKRQAIKGFLWSDRPPRFARSVDPAELPGNQAIALWPSRAPRDLPARAADAGVPVARIEDGFIRSIGLGTHLHPPRSIVVDWAGIYYDPSGPSSLERLLNETIFDARLLTRAAALIKDLRALGITKYAAGGRDSIRLPLPPTVRRRILVPGQVEDDLSVRCGAAGVTGNLDLLRRVRAAEPDAWIAYKPHPDVAAGLRKGGVSRDDILRYANAMIAGGTMASLLNQVDVVHVLTSLTGFEALLRGCEVVTHGQPFYAGWGLTVDKAAPLMRRQRRLTLEQLVAGALILYPRYLDPLTKLPCPPEVLVERHRQAGSRPHAGLLNRLRITQGRIALAARWLASVEA